MERSLTIACFFWLWLCVGLVGAGEAVDATVEEKAALLRRQALKGYTAVRVSVSIRPAGDVGGMKQADIKNYIEVDLRRHGVSIDDSPANEGSPETTASLSLSVHTSRMMDTPVIGKTRAFSLRLQVAETVSLLRAPAITTTATTWWSDRITGVDAPGLPESRKLAEQYMSLLTSAFAKDFAAANAED